MPRAKRATDSLPKTPKKTITMINGSKIDYTKKTPKKRKRVYRVEMELVEQVENDSTWYRLDYLKHLIPENLEHIDFITVKNLKIRRVKA